MVFSVPLSVALEDLTDKLPSLMIKKNKNKKVPSRIAHYLDGLDPPTERLVLRATSVVLLGF